MKFDLAWGNSVCVREAFVSTCNQQPVVFGPEALMKFDYPKHDGDPELIELTRAIIKRQIGQDYRHIFITNGATGGCVIALRAFYERGFENCVTRNAPYYVRYPAMIRAAGLNHIDEGFWQVDTVALIDIPSNPLGAMSNVAKINVPVILDGVYLNRVYMNPNQVTTIPHDIYVGSYSKLLGINGIRLGWIATNSDLLAIRLAELVTSEYCGLSTASQEILKSSLTDFSWEIFETKARLKLNYNRESWSILERYFGGKPVTDVGMFYYAPMDKKCRKLLEKAGVSWTKGSAMGTDDNYGRINLGQDNLLISQAVRAIIKADMLT
jgi:aspartate/methionine/tyrosine aminotransferase